MKILGSFNWVDVLIILVLIRSVYLGAKSGMTPELFKLIGTVISIVLGFHYYEQISNVLLRYLRLPVWLAQFVVLYGIILSFRIAFKYGVILLLRVLKIQFVTQLEKIGGSLIGLARGFLVGGLVVIGLLFFPVEYFGSSVAEKSFLANRLIAATKRTYIHIISIIPSQEARTITIPPVTE